MQRVALLVHDARLAVGPQADTREVAKLLAQPLAGDKQLAQGVGVRHAVVVHDPDVVIAKLDGLAHAEVEAAGAAEVLPGVEVANLTGLDARCQRLLGTVGARVVHDDDAELVALPQRRQLLGLQAVEALLEKLHAVVGDDDRGDRLASARARH